MGPPIAWVDAFVDLPVAVAADYRRFWSAVTGWSESAPRGDRGQFRSLLPDPAVATRAYLRVQELERPPRVHLDLVSGDLDGDALRLAGLGARPVADRPGVRILASPAGQVFCLVTDDEPRQVGPRSSWATRWPDGQRSRFAQLCLDVPPAAYDVELAFWTEATGWRPRPSVRTEFTHLVPPPGVPLQLLVQRLGQADDRLGAHLDLACDDIPTEVGRLVRLGAVDVGPGAGWHTLRDPVAGMPFCVTSQQP